MAVRIVVLSSGQLAAAIGLIWLLIRIEVRSFGSLVRAASSYGRVPHSSFWPLAWGLW